MIEMALFIVGTGICVLVILFLISVVFQALGVVCGVIWDIVNPYGPIRGKREDSSDDSR